MAVLLIVVLLLCVCLRWSVETMAESRTKIWPEKNLFTSPMAMCGSRGGGQSDKTRLENYKWLYVSLEILVGTPPEKSNCFSREVRPVNCPVLNHFYFKAYSK